MLTRKTFLIRLGQLGAILPFATLIGCGKAEDESSELLNDENYVTLYDTHAMALYFDGSLGPKTGVIKVEHIIAHEDVEFQFWHGHRGQQHRFTLTKEAINRLKRKEKVILETTIVDGHSHKLFIDPNDVRYRVAGAQPVRVPL